MTLPCRHCAGTGKQHWSIQGANDPYSVPDGECPECSGTGDEPEPEIEDEEDE